MDTAYGKENKKTSPIVFCYDFDGTLIPGNMQEYGLIQDLGYASPADFWCEVAAYTKETGSESVLSYMKYIADKSASMGFVMTKDSLGGYGSRLPYFAGVEGWFKAVNKIAGSRGIRTEHYIVSSGLAEILEGTSIAGNFSGIFASSYIYDPEGHPVWPSRIVNYTGKTQYLYRISKNAMDLGNDRRVNSVIPAEKRRVPFSNMIYIGDGETDIPCMQVIKDAGGLSIAVYDPENRRKKNIAERLKTDGRVQCAFPADYTENSLLMKTVTGMIEKTVSAAGIPRCEEEVFEPCL